jgi:hypothetical protein
VNFGFSSQSDFLSIGLEPSQVSTYSGIAESLIALVQLITLPFVCLRSVQQHVQARPDDL